MDMALPELTLSVTSDQEIRFHGEMALGEFERHLAEVEVKMREFYSKLANLIVQKADPTDVAEMSLVIRNAEHDRERLKAAGADLRMSIQMYETRLMNVYT